MTDCDWFVKKEFIWRDNGEREREWESPEQSIVSGIIKGISHMRCHNKKSNKIKSVHLLITSTIEMSIDRLWLRKVLLNVDKKMAFIAVRKWVENTKGTIQIASIGWKLPLILIQIYIPELDFRMGLNSRNTR